MASKLKIDNCDSQLCEKCPALGKECNPKLGLENLERTNEKNDN